MPPAEELAAAADKLRGAARLANNGPWIATPDVLIGGWAIAQAPMPSDEGPYLADFVRDCDARYIAAMHPGVGAALADWLERAAGHVSAQYTCCDNGEHMCWQIASPALAVARAILNQPDRSQP
jgi:hypothetical protein